MRHDILPPGHDRYVRHQLVFELGGAAMLAGVTREWALVATMGAVLLPAVRSTWLWWIRSSVGLVWMGLAAFAAAFAGLHAVAGVWLAGCAIGIARLGLRPSQLGNRGSRVGGRPSVPVGTGHGRGPGRDPQGGTPHRCSTSNSSSAPGPQCQSDPIRCQDR